MMPMFHFSHPICLLLAIPAWILHRRLGRARGLRGAIRLALTLVLVVMIAGPVGPAREIGSTLVLVIDQSRSMPMGIVSHKARLLAEANSRKRAADSLALIVFGATPLVEQFPDPSRPPQTSLGRTLNIDQTNLHAAISAALDLVPEGAAGLILIVSDGKSDDAISDEMVAQLRRRAVPVYFQHFPLDDLPMSEDVELRSVSGPTELDQGDELRLAYQVESPVELATSLEIRRDNEMLAIVPVQLNRGTNTGTWTGATDRAGVFRYSLSLHTTNDTTAGNNRWEQWVRVRGVSTILVVNAAGLDTPMVEMLKSAAVNVEVSAADKFDGSLEKLCAYAACVLENVGPAELGPIASQSLAAFVQRLGGGLVITGGDRSFGTGGYRSSPLDPLLPVALRPLNTSERAPQSLVVLVDPAAWEAQAYDTQELSPLQSALLALVADLDPMDRIGIVATRSPEPVILPLTVAGKRDVRETIAHLGFSSDPVTFPRALNAAWDMLAGASQSARHLLVLTETNQLNSWPPRQLDPLVNQPIAGATLTVVTWGTPDAESLSQWRSRLRNGRIIPTREVQDLASVLRLDWQLSTGGSYVARSATMQQTIDPLSEPSRIVPPLTRTIDGFYTATLRDSATLIAGVKDIPTQPLIARWDCGLGRVCTTLFRIETAGEDALQDKHLKALLVEQIRWIGRADRSDAAARPVVELTGQTLTVRLSSGHGDTAQAPSDVVALEVTRADGSAAGTAAFNRDGPGTTAQFQLQGMQSHIATIRTEDAMVTRCAPVVLPRSTEFLWQENADAGRTVLVRLAQESGGAEWLPGSALFEGPEEQYSSLVPALAWCTLMLLMLDVADRRYQFSGRIQLHWQRRWAPKKKREPNETPSEFAQDPFEVAKERMRRRVQR
jgi:uncharacterized membrane protein